MNHYGAAVYDGTVRRGASSGIYTADRVEKTTNANIVVTYQNYSSGFELKRWNVTSTGLTQAQSVSNLISGYYVDIKNSGNNLLSSSGLLVDTATFTLRSNLGVGGRVASDAPNSRAFVVNGNAIRGFDATNGNYFGALPLPTNQNGDWAQACVRWGLDGLAVLGNDSKIYIGRWSAVIPPTVDTNGDLMSDAWQATYFGTLNVSAGADADNDGIANGFEYLFGTSPVAANGSPVQVSTTIVNSERVMRMTFARRAQLVAQCYSYEVSTDVTQWAPAASVTETVIGTQLIGGVQMQIVEAIIPAPAPTAGFARLKWLGP
jgi:hypothetical protein